MLKRLCDAGLYIRLSKCEFNAQHVSFVGFIVSPHRVEMEPDRIRTITKWPMPTSYCDIQVFLRFANILLQVYRELLEEY